MIYLEAFDLATELDETDYFFRTTKFDTEYYSKTNAYPFKIFPFKRISHLEFAPVTIIYGGNGSGKSTLLNVIAEKLSLLRTAPFNHTPVMQDYLDLCSYKLSAKAKYRVPADSAIITSDGVFDFLLDARAINDGIDRQREELFLEYSELRREKWQLSGLDEYDELKRRNEAKLNSRSKYVGRRMDSVELDMKSNGESAFVYFTQKIKENALYLLDEPENSLSASLQAELASFLEDSARFYNCQLIISTHSPFLLSLKGARIYDLDSVPVKVRKWTELENVRAYHQLFKIHENEF